MNPDKTLTVRLNQEFTGYLERDKQGGFVFTYAPENKSQLSMSLPLQKESYDNNSCRGFFEGLLPEGEQIRVFIGKKYGINPKNEFSLLKAIGYDCAGAVSFGEYEENPKSFKSGFIPLEGKKFTDESLEKYITELPFKPLLTNSDGLRLSLAGTQDKMAIILIDNTPALPDKDVPTTYILKPEIKDVEDSIENEFICLKTAQRLGLKVCDSEIRRTKNLKYLLIKRYDREIKDNKVIRIHQEDFCQAKNIISTFKYEREGGISIKDCYDILKKTKTPVKNVNELSNRIIFNYLIGNNDAHGKNFSLLYMADGVEFAPAYDILSTMVYPDLTQKMAMKIGGHYEHNKILPRHWKKMADESEISYTQLKKMIIKQAGILPQELKKVIDENKINSEIAEKMLKLVTQNCKKVLKRFEEAPL